MTNKEIIKLLEDVKKGKKSVVEASLEIGKMIDAIKVINALIPPAIGGDS